MEQHEVSSTLDDPTLDQPEPTAEELEAKKREVYCAGLEDLATFLRQHPTLPLPQSRMIEYVYGGKVTFASYVRDLGTSEKEYTDWAVNVFKNFGPIKYGVYCSRETVCEKVVTGKKIVPLQPSNYYPEIPEHEEDIIEWKCSAILDTETTENPPEAA